jgi:hypothetical protein
MADEKKKPGPKPKEPPKVVTMPNGEKVTVKPEKKVTEKKERKKKEPEPEPEPEEIGPIPNPFTAGVAVNMTIFDPADMASNAAQRVITTAPTSKFNELKEILAAIIDEHMEECPGAALQLRTFGQRNWVVVSEAPVSDEPNAKRGIYKETAIPIPE